MVIIDATGSAQALSGVTVAQFGPILLLSLPAGRVISRIHPRTVLTICALGAAAAICGLAFVVDTAAQSLLPVYALIATIGAMNAFERVAAPALIHTLVEHGRLGNAVATYTMALSVARSVGPGMAAWAFTSWGAGPCLMINATSFLLVALSLRFVPARETAAPRPGAGRSAAFLFRNQRFTTIFSVNLVIALFSLNIMVVTTSLVTLTLAGDAAALGLVHSLNAVGAIAGGLVAASRLSYGPRTLIVGSLTLAIALAVNAIAPTIVVLAALSPLLGGALGYYQGLITAGAQSVVEPGQIAPAMALLTFGQYGMIPVGALITGVIIDLSSARVSMSVSAAVAALVALGVVLRTRTDETPP